MKQETKFSMLLKSIWMLRNQENTFNGDATLSVSDFQSATTRKADAPQIVRLGEGGWYRRSEQSRYACLGCILMERILVIDALLK